MSAVIRLGHDQAGNVVGLDDETLKRHVFVLGSTGSGKTNLLCSMAGDAIGAGRGLIFLDGKGDKSCYRKIRKMARDAGREEDVMLLDMSIPAKGEVATSNTINPFAKSGAASIVQMIVGMMSAPVGEGVFWQDRAISLVSCVVRALHFLRDTNVTDFSPVVFRDQLSLRRVIELADPDHHPAMPDNIRKSILAYLESLPGFYWEKRFKQSQTTLDQHGFLHMQLTRLLGGLIDDYGHAIAEGRGEIDLAEIREENRILVVLLPTLGKSSSETTFVAQVILSLLQEMIAGSREVVDADSPPFMVFLDEFASYARDGIEAMAAQGRSLGFSFVFSAQTLVDPKGDPGGRLLDSVLGNTGTKLLMRADRLDMDKLAEIAPALVEKPIEARRMRLRQRMADAREMISMQGHAGISDASFERVRDGYAMDAAELVSLSDLDDPTPKDLTALGPGRMLVAQGLVPVSAIDLGPFPMDSDLYGPVTSRAMKLESIQSAIAKDVCPLPECLVSKIEDGMLAEDVVRITAEALVEMSPE